MILTPLLRVQLLPKLNCWINQSRGIRPSIKIDKERFQLSVDVRNFDKDEIRVKARQEFLIIEGKQEKKTKRGFIMRHFCRKFRLPDGCVVENMQSKLTADGILTITAPRKVCEQNYPCETLIPISHTGKPKEEEPMIPTAKEDVDNVCKYYINAAKTENKPDDKKKK